MKKITIAQALKLKNKQINLINKIAEIVRSWNSVDEPHLRPYDVRENLIKYFEEQDKLINIKVAIHKASEPIRELIFRQSELKTRIAFLRSIDTTNGIKRDRFSTHEYAQSAEIGVKEIDDLITEYEYEIENIQEELDKFNHKKLVQLLE